MMLFQYLSKSSRAYIFSHITIRKRYIFCLAKNGPCVTNEGLCNKAIIAKHSNNATLDRSIGTFFPNITDFTNCKDYLRKSISGRSFDANSDDWEYLLDQIVETLPAETGNIQEFEETKESRKHGKFRGTTNFVKQYHCHSFALNVCVEVGNISAAFALLEQMKRSNEKITDIHRKLVLKAFQRHFERENDGIKSGDLKSLSVKDKLVEAKLVDQVICICDDVIKNERLATDYSHLDALISVATTLAYTSKWLDGYELWDKLRTYDSTKLKICTDSEPTFLSDPATPVFGRLHKCAYTLAKSALRDGREDLFWIILNDHSFHNNHVYIRYGVNNEMLKKNEEIFEEYLRHCKEKFKGSSVESFDALSKLFEYMRKHFMLISMSFYKVLEDMFLENELSIDTQAAFRKGMKKCVRVKQTKLGDAYHCKNCRQPIGSPHLSQKDIDLLKDNIISRLIVKDDIYQSSHPNELKKFDAILAKNENFDIVVDGLNVCGLASQEVKTKEYYTKERKYSLKNFQNNQNFILYTVLKKLKQQGLKTLLIHRKHLKRFQNFNEIRELCQYVILDDTSNDDPFFIAAALNSGPKTYILTNDLLRVHNNQLNDPYLQRIFSYWQMLCQVRCKWLAYKSCRSDEKGLFNAEDGSYRKPQLYFPDNRVIRATRNSHGWHIPITPAIPVQNKANNVPITMIRPTDWACISK